jgi:catechol 2,3-dioxygenase-like lactoylglutathione lyase family enzyme
MAITDAYAKLPAQDVERARAFYAKHFGLEPFGERHGHLYYDVAGTPLLIFPSTGSPSGTHDQLGLVVDDLDAEAERLRANGVQFEEFPGPPDATIRDGIIDRGFMKAGWFKDSEGNLISIAEFAEGSPLRREAG